MGGGPGIGRRPGAHLALMLVIAIVLGIAVYQIGSLIGQGVSSVPGLGAGRPPILYTSGSTGGLSEGY